MYIFFSLYYFLLLNQTKNCPFFPDVPQTVPSCSEYSQGGSNYENEMAPGDREDTENSTGHNQWVSESGHLGRCDRT